MSAQISSIFIHPLSLRVRGSVPVLPSLASPFPRYPCLSPRWAVTPCAAGLSEPRSGSGLGSEARTNTLPRGEQSKQRSPNKARVPAGAFICSRKRWDTAPGRTRMCKPDQRTRRPCPERPGVPSGRTDRKSVV